VLTCPGPLCCIAAPVHASWVYGARGEEEYHVLEFDTSWIGKEFDRYTYHVTKEEIIEFAASIGEKNPLYTDEAYARTTPYRGLVAPPTFSVVFRSQAMMPDLKLNYGKRGFDGGKECQFYAPIRPGDTITGIDRIAEVYEKTGRSGSMIFIIRESEFTNQQGEKVAVIRQSLIRRD
jgi:acyl dehydratase